MKWTIGFLVLIYSFAIDAQEPGYPQRGPIEITVLFPAGTSADVTARMLAEGMSKHLNQRVLVVNRPGAGGAIGYKYVASQKPDGYALVWNSNSISTTFHSGQLGFDYQAFDAVARVLVESVVVAVRGDSRWRTLTELVQEAKAKPKVVSVGHSGIGSHTHISLAALFHASGVEVNEVPFGAAQVVPSLLGGHVDAVVQLPAALAAPVKQGQVRLLAALIPNRDPALPDVPTAKEQGIDVSLEAWRGIAVPRGTPRAVIAQLETAIRTTAASAEFLRGSENLGVRPAFLPADEFNDLIAREDASLSRLMQLIGLKK
jgi:tripartite-type tricarboxylate transporter receptor subunit TctC